MATEPEISLPLDCEKLLAECDDEQSFVNRWLHIFVRDAQMDMNDIALALDRSDFPQIARLAHRIKGSSASIKAEFLRQQAARLEVLSAKEELVAASECFAGLRAEFEHFKSYIASLPLLAD
jgi:HPt (histidine-containing phosphotransfer) domain-containing protein